MSTAKEYLETLYQQEPQLFSEPLKMSILVEPDLQFIEQQIGHRLPKQFVEFLTTYQLPQMTMFITFCGDLASALYKTFSREKNGYVLSKSEEFVVVDFTWNGMNGNCGVDYLKNFERYELSEAWLKAGFIDIGSFYVESYLVFYDLVTEKVCFIHNEDIMEASVDWDNITNIRTFMLENSRLLGNSFNDFLRTVCTGEPYDDEIIFLGEKSL